MLGQVICQMYEEIFRMPMAADEYFALRRLAIEAAAKVLLSRAAPCG